MNASVREHVGHSTQPLASLAQTRGAGVEGIAERLAPTFEAYGVRRAILFGSAARGELSRRSDLDLIVIKPTPQRFLERYEGLLADLTAAGGGRAIDALIYTPEEFARMSDRAFIQKALREGVTIYESGKEPASRRAMAANR